jgi:hypothetical protein
MPKNNTRSRKNRRHSPLTVNTSHNVGPTNRRGRGRGGERTRRRNIHSTANNRNIPGTRNRNGNRNNSTKKNYRQQLNKVRKVTNRKTKIISKNPNSVGLRKKLLQRGQMVNVNHRVAVAEEEERLAAAEEAKRLAAEEAEMDEEEEPINFNDNGPVPRFNGPVRRSNSSLF